MAAAAGVPPQRLRNSSFRRLFRDAYVAAQLPLTLEVRSAAALLVMPPGTVISHWTCLALLGLDYEQGRDEVHVTPPPSASRPRHQRGIRVHERSASSPSLSVRGLPVSGPGRTFVDMAALVPPDELVVIGDHLLRRAGGLDALVEGLERERGQRHVVRARRALPLLRVGVDSPPETRLRLRIVRFGLPEPEVNITVRDRAGGWLGRAELGYRKERVLIQYEGDIHRTDRRRWRKDIARDESYRDEGWAVLRATADDVERPRRFCLRLQRLLTAADQAA